jgi:hypothetical protein
MTRLRLISWIVFAATAIPLVVRTCPPALSVSQSFAAEAASGNANQPRPSTGQALPELPSDSLSAQERLGSQIAEQNKDGDFLMVDKPIGKIILFENGKPVFSSAALTGESKTDRLPPGALSKRFSQLGALEDKVTPAGRFTVSRDFDSNYGPLFDVNEIQGRDWTIAIHQVYLGTPSERRAYRLQSPNHVDKHITHGCINVTMETIRFLMDRLPKNRRAVLYVLPHDQSKTAEYLARPN